MDRPRVLVVDDDCEIRALLETALRSDDHEVLCCRDGAEALQVLLEQGQPALLIVDLMMPVMNGWELLSHLHRHPHFRDLPVLVLTAAGAHWGYPVPHEQVIQKPFDLNLLLEHVALLLRRRRSGAG